MKNRTWLAVTLFACLGWGMAISQSQPSPDVCAFDRAKMLALNERDFDQDLTGGWRTLAMHDECLLITADLIRDYLLAKSPTSKILFWHEGQMRAFAGQTEPAILLFETTREPVNDWFGWNLYVDATIPF
jgi:hypothetical protein